ncbi:MAG: hypothetical protein ACKO37_04510 [Vampirovibrionales bacterium]
MSKTLSNNDRLLLTKLHRILHPCFPYPVETFRGEDVLYNRLNALRTWINTTIPGVELYLEDVWHERIAHKTCFEYILRSLRTKDETSPIGFDCYSHSQDHQGVWHLEAYEYSVCLMPDLTPLIFFLQDHGPEPWQGYVTHLVETF